ncbi:MAG: hypothetical protein NT121_05155 [Chloroflexi bacterium]|nr:hypothetical protein [Chloroflexota bacterium]
MPAPCLAAQRLRSTFCRPNRHARPNRNGNADFDALPPHHAAAHPHPHAPAPYSPTRLPLTRLTNGQWDDVSPSISPDGSKVVFASNRNEYWDLYTLNLQDGQIGRVTDTAEFDGNPGWSPDSQWIVYETMIGEQMEINILSTVNGQTIQLTNDPALDQDPVWSPLRRQVAFVSNRTGDDEIWAANLDKPDEGRFVNVSQAPGSAESRPAWSQDGSKLAWASRIEAQPAAIYTWDSNRPDQLPRFAGNGDWPLWSVSGNEIATRLSEAPGARQRPAGDLLQIGPADSHLARANANSAGGQCPRAARCHHPDPGFGSPASLPA